MNLIEKKIPPQSVHNSHKKGLLVLFTARYPFGLRGEKTFLQEEIKCLHEVFDRVVLVPRHLSGEKLDLPENVEVDETYSAYLNHANKLVLLFKVLQSQYFWKEVAIHPSILLYPAAIYRVFAFFAGALMTMEWTKNWLIDNCADGSILFYTYWFDHAAMGVGILKRSYPTIRVVSRAHGYDLYEETYYKPPFWPGRRIALEALDGLFTISNAGLVYMVDRYPDFREKYYLSMLGVPDPFFQTRGSTDGVLRVVSCAYVEKVKRIGLLFDGLKRAAKLRPNQQFEWSHFGDGEEWAQMKKRVERETLPNLTVYFPGHVPQSEINDHYLKNAVDVFVNVSLTEGIPVSIMEAISCGIPVIATDVGGNPEIVSETNGVLTSPDPSPEEIADAIFQFIDNPSMSAAKRKGSYDVWRRKFNADENFRKFAEQLRSIGES